MPDASVLSGPQAAVSEGPDTPKSVASTGESLTVSLVRSTEGKYNLTFKHDSANNTVAISEIRANDKPDDRANVRVNDVVMRVNGVPTVCRTGCPMPPAIRACILTDCGTPP